MEEVFTNIYENKSWGNSINDEYSGSSGAGSHIYHNINTYVPFLKKFIIDNNIKNVVDLGCGDFLCGNLIYNNLDISSYTGYDTYLKLINHHIKHYSSPKYSFIHLDFCNYKEDIVGGDLCILKDVLMHWSLDNINTFLDYLIKSKKFKYILICNCSDQLEDNTNIVNGQWRQLSANYYPLKKYNPKIIYNFMSNDMKEVSLITI